ncbi:MAG: twin-arginine translocase TatA/TatE family subunit [Anditalea sp.]
MSTLGFIQNLGGGSIVLILVVILLLFGAKRIPELAKGIGRGLTEFKNATKEVQEDMEKGVKDKKE